MYPLPAVLLERPQRFATRSPFRHQIGPITLARSPTRGRVRQRRAAYRITPCRCTVNPNFLRTDTAPAFPPSKSEGPRRWPVKVRKPCPDGLVRVTAVLPDQFVAPTGAETMVSKEALRPPSVVLLHRSHHVVRGHVCPQFGQCI